MSVIAGPPPPRPSEVRWFSKNSDPFVHAALTSVCELLIVALAVAALLAPLPSRPMKVDLTRQSGNGGASVPPTTIA